MVRATLLLAALLPLLGGCGTERHGSHLGVLRLSNGAPVGVGHLIVRLAVVDDRGAVVRTHGDLLLPGQAVEYVPAGGAYVVDVTWDGGTQGLFDVEVRDTPTQHTLELDWLSSDPEEEADPFFEKRVPDCPLRVTELGLVR